MVLSSSAEEEPLTFSPSPEDSLPILPTELVQDDPSPAGRPASSDFGAPLPQLDCLSFAGLHCWPVGSPLPPAHVQIPALPGCTSLLSYLGHPGYGSPHVLVVNVFSIPPRRGCVRVIPVWPGLVAQGLAHSSDR